MYRSISLARVLKTNAKLNTRFNYTQSEPLYDNYGRAHDYLRISLTEKCNLRCKYCMPEEGIKLTDRKDCLTLDEFKRLSSIFIKLCGIKKVRLTGGEPTMDKKLAPLIEHLVELKEYGLKTVAMTTNGLTLQKQGTLLKDKGLNAINVSLDTLQEKRFERLTRRKGWSLAYQGILSAIEANFDAVKVNCVLMKGINDDEILDFAGLAERYRVEVRFIEFMPFAGNKWDSDKMIEYHKVLKILSEKYPNLKRRQPVPNEVSKVYESPSMLGTIGFISSMSNNFCSGCNRLRLTSDGNLKVCLFEQQEISLRDLIRNGANDAEVVKAVSASLKQKKKQHSGMSSLQYETSRPMIKIGTREYHNSAHEKKFSHLNSEGRANMVDVGAKTKMKRTAVARGKIIVGLEVLAKICDRSMSKGEILSVSRVAGIMGAKSTNNSLVVTALVVAHHVTGVEMESLTAVTITLLTIYDMCKSVNKFMVISEVKLLSKMKE